MVVMRESSDARLTADKLEKLGNEVRTALRDAMAVVQHPWVQQPAARTPDCSSSRFNIRAGGRP